LDHQNNYAECSNVDDKALQQKVLIIVNVSINYFDGPNKIKFRPVFS